MKTRRLLSYELNTDTPAYGAGESFSMKSCKSINQGDSCNTAQFSFPNHLGTHVDSPAHFFDGAETVTSVNSDFWFFSAPAVIEVVINETELFSDTTCFEGLHENVDILLLKTGFSEKRGHCAYATHGPGLSADVGFFLRERFKNLRMIGFDFISLSSFQHREQGRKAHEAFLDPNGAGSPIWILEDMDLSSVSQATELSEVLVSPLFVTKADGSPCTVWATLNS